MSATHPALSLAALDDARHRSADAWRLALGCGVADVATLPLEDILVRIGFSAEDAEALREVTAPARGDTDAITRGIRERMLGAEISPGAFDQAIAVWLSDLLDGAHDHGYFEARATLAAGRVLSSLPPARLLAGVHLLRTELSRRAFEAREPARAVEAVAKLLDVELAILLAARDVRTSRAPLATTLVEHLPLRAFLLDADDRVLAHTPLARASCRASLETAVGAPLAEVLAEPLWERAELARWLAFARDSRGEVVVPRVDLLERGAPSSFRVSVLPLPGTGGDVLVHLEDLTEAIAEEGRARHAWHVAQLGIMASAVAHEIRNPLAGISGSLQVIQASLPMHDERRDALDKVGGQVRALGRVVADLILFARPIRAAQEPVDLRAIADEVASRFGDEIRIEIRGAGHASGDCGLVARVLGNLLDNARQADARRVRLEIGPGWVEAHDDGPGLPMADPERAFEPFFSTRTRGSGLGLPIARRSAEAMGGRLAACPGRLGGAAFRLTLKP